MTLRELLLADLAVNWRHRGAEAVPSGSARRHPIDRRSRDSHPLCSSGLRRPPISVVVAGRASERCLPC